MERNEIIASFGYAGVRKLYIEQFNKDYDENWQCVHTPYDICHEMFELIPKDATHFVVFYSLEFLEVMVKEHNIDPYRILFVADTVYEQQFAMIKELYGVYSIVLGRNDVFVDGVFSESNFQNAIRNCYHYSVEEIFGKDENMKFNKLAVLGNPPYQITDGGHKASAKPLYHKFVETIIDSLNPDYFSMIIPSRWMVGGKGLDKHRERMMNDRRMKVIVDDMSSNGVFHSVDIAGGVNYFLWEKSYNGPCNFNGIERNLNQFDIIVRENESVSILTRVLDSASKFVSASVSARKPYGFEADTEALNSGIPCMFKQSIGKKFVEPSIVTDPRNDINSWRVLVPRAPIAGQTDFTKPIAFFTDNNVIIIEPGCVCTETYLVANSFKTKTEAEHFVTYMKTKFFRFMLRMRVVSQDVTRDCYAWVPDVIDYSVPWTDEELYKKFNLTRQQIAYIESKIKAIK